MQINESEYTRIICNEIKDYGGIVIPYVASNMNAIGIPDRLVIHRLVGIILIEFKGLKTKLKPHQAYKIKEINRLVHNGAFIVRAPDTIRDGNDQCKAIFDGTGKGLINCLAELIKNERS